MMRCVIPVEQSFGDTETNTFELPTFSTCISSWKCHYIMYAGQKTKVYEGMTHRHLIATINSRPCRTKLFKNSKIEVGSGLVGIGIGNEEMIKDQMEHVYQISLNEAHKISISISTLQISISEFREMAPVSPPTATILAEPKRDDFCLPQLIVLDERNNASCQNHKRNETAIWDHSYS